MVSRDMRRAGNYGRTFLNDLLGSAAIILLGVIVVVCKVMGQR